MRPIKYPSRQCNDAILYIRNKRYQNLVDTEYLSWECLLKTRLLAGQKQ